MLDREGESGGLAGHESEWLRGHDGQVALRDPSTGNVLTYAALRDRIGVVAGQLVALGVGAGDVVAYSLPNGIETVVMFLATLACRAAAAPFNPAFTADEVNRFVSDLEPRIMVIDATSALKVGSLADSSGPRLVALEGAGTSLRLRAANGRTHTSSFDAEAVALVLHTSGTTGRPKVVPLRARNLLASAHSIARHYSLCPDDVSHCVMPLFHIHGLIGATLAPLVTGGSVLVPSRFSAGSFWDDGGAGGATWFSAVPTIHQILLARAGSFGSPKHTLRFARSSSASLPPPVMEAFEETFSIPLVEAYGMTEAAHQMASNPLPPGERRPGTVGISAGAELRIVERDGWAPLPVGAAGEVTIRGAGVVDGYLDNPEANEASFRDGWFRTGDSGSLDADGYLRLDGRIKELINRGGEKISPHEVEDVLLRHEAVSEAVAFGVPDAKYGEVVSAAVVLQAPATERALREHCATYLASFKVPVAIRTLDEIPKGPTGKLQRRLLSELFGDS